jgi:bifunctional DNA-binding transcriptional regulator/antitoxin component of YhaV-PrlF toxin-antitoxin module
LLLEPVSFLLAVRGADASHSKGQITIPQAIRERWGLLPHTEVHFVEEGSRVFLEQDNGQPSRGQEAVQRLRQARLRTKLSTDQLLALTRGESEAGEQR